MEFPAFYVPDEGEVVIAARSRSGPYLRAAVTLVRRASQNKIRVNFVWLEDCADTVTGVPVVKGTKGHAYISTDDKAPLILRLPAPPPHSAPHEGTEHDGDGTVTPA
jgi:hypothetical protein